MRRAAPIERAAPAALPEGARSSAPCAPGRRNRAWERARPRSRHCGRAFRAAALRASGGPPVDSGRQGSRIEGDEKARDPGRDDRRSAGRPGRELPALRAVVRHRPLGAGHGVVRRRLGRGRRLVFEVPGSAPRPPRPRARSPEERRADRARPLPAKPRGLARRLLRQLSASPLRQEVRAAEEREPTGVPRGDPQRRSRVRDRAGGHGQDLSRRRHGRDIPERAPGQPDHPGASRGRSRREAGLPPRRSRRKGRSVPAAPVRLALRSHRSRSGRAPAGEGDDRGRAPGVHARPDDERRLHDPG